MSRLSSGLRRPGKLRPRVGPSASLGYGPSPSSSLLPPSMCWPVACCAAGPSKRAIATGEGAAPADGRRACAGLPAPGGAIACVGQPSASPFRSARACSPCSNAQCNWRRLALSRRRRTAPGAGEQLRTWFEFAEIDALNLRQRNERGALLGDEAVLGEQRGASAQPHGLQAQGVLSTVRTWRSP
jgi:hypothetical protein